jgi:hypothetical protein
MKLEEKNAARDLRKQGYSIPDICKRLGVSKSSVSIWVRDIQLTADQIEVLNQRMARARERFAYLSRCGGANTNRAKAEKRHRAFEQAGYERAKVDDNFRLICALYWGEGSKCNTHTFSVSNCDPRLLRAILDWLVRVGYDERAGFSVQYYGENGLTEEDIRLWWLKQLPNLKEKHLRKFTRCVIHRASQRKKIGKRPYGTARVSVSDTELVFTVAGGIRYLQEKCDW